MIGDVTTVPVHYPLSPLTVLLVGYAESSHSGLSVPTIVGVVVAIVVVAVIIMVVVVVVVLLCRRRRLVNTRKFKLFVQHSSDFSPS